MGLQVTKEKPKVNALLIARKQYKNLLDPLYKDYDICIRKIIGRKKSLSVLIDRLDNYKEQTFFVIDINAVAEKGDELAERLTFITKKRKDMRLVLFAPEAKPGNAEIDYLVKRGFVNIVVNSADELKDKWNKIIKNLCIFFEGQQLSSERVAQLVNPNPNPQIIALTDRAEKTGSAETVMEDNFKEKEDESKKPADIPNYSKTYTSVDFYGIQRRIGTTYAALITAAYFVKGKANPLVFLGSKREYDRLAEYYDNKTVVSDCLTEINGIYLTFCDAPIGSDADKSAFNIVIRDRGVFRAFDEKSSVNVIVGGVSYNEIGNTLKVHKALDEQKADYISMLSFAEGKPDNFISGKKSVTIPYTIDPTVFSESAATAFNSIFGELA